MGVCRLPDPPFGGCCPSDPPLYYAGPVAQTLLKKDPKTSSSSSIRLAANAKLRKKMVRRRVCYFGGGDNVDDYQLRCEVLAYGYQRAHVGPKFGCGAPKVRPNYILTRPAVARLRSLKP